MLKINITLPQKSKPSKDGSSSIKLTTEKPVKDGVTCNPLWKEKKFGNTTKKQLTTLEETNKSSLQDSNTLKPLLPLLPSKDPLKEFTSNTEMSVDGKTLPVLKLYSTTLINLPPLPVVNVLSCILNLTIKENSSIIVMKTITSTWILPLSISPKELNIKYGTLPNSRTFPQYTPDPKKTQKELTSNFYSNNKFQEWKLSRTRNIWNYQDST